MAEEHDLPTVVLAEHLGSRAAAMKACMDVFRNFDQDAKDKRRLRCD